MPLDVLCALLLSTIVGCTIAVLWVWYMWRKYQRQAEERQFQQYWATLGLDDTLGDILTDNECCPRAMSVARET